MAKETLGFVGLGLMGRPMAANLAKAGYDVTVYNRTRSKAEDLAKEVKVTVVDSPADVARAADIVVTMAGDTPDVQEIVLGPEGLLQGASQGMVIIDMSTMSPAATKEMAARLAEKGVEMVDAPVSGLPTKAAEGTLTIMAGAKKEVFDRVLPVFEVLGATITHMGGNGAGQATKLCNQIICSTTLLSVAEGLVYASRAGLDLNKVIDALMGGAAQSLILDFMGRKMAVHDFEPGFFVRHEQKDLRLVLQAACDMGMSLPGAAIVQQLYNSIEKPEGRSEDAHWCLIRAIEKLAGHEVV